MKPKPIAQIARAAPSRIASLHPKRIAVFRALQLGDLLCATPALRALRAAHPDAHLTFIGLRWARELCERLAYVDEFIAFPGFPGLPEIEPQLERIPEFLARVQASRFDLIVQMRGSGALVNPIVVACGARGRILPRSTALYGMARAWHRNHGAYRAAWCADAGRLDRLSAQRG